MTTLRKNQFEDLIDQMMIDEVAGLDQEIKATLQGLSTDKKRMAILSILDKDRDMFMRIKKMVDGNDVSKAEHIKNVVSMLRGYVEVGDREQKEYGEVFTKYSTISEMLLLVPETDWSNPNLKFLDSCAGAGNFPAVIIEKLMDGLSEVFPDQEERYRHIVENMIYMVELQAKNAFLILAALDPQDTYELNIFHGSFLSDEFDQHAKEVWGVDSWSYVIQNPPYQELIEGNSRMKPLYHVFIEKALKISDRLISIHPSRWMTGGMGLDKFRKMMFDRTDIKLIKHWDNSQEVFGKMVEIKGGVQYFLIDQSYSGRVSYNGVECELGKYDIFVEPKYRAIVEKVNASGASIKDICTSTYGIMTNDSRLKDSIETQNDIKCYVSVQKGKEKFIDSSILRENSDLDKYKVFTPRATGSTGNLGYFGNKIIGGINEICSQSYISFISDTENQAKSIYSYLSTEFCNFFLSLRKNTQDIKMDTLSFIPLVPFDREWNDDMLFEYFGLTEEEKELILNK